MVMSGRALRSAAMCFLACIAYIQPKPGSSKAMRLMAAWASVKAVTPSGVVWRLAAISKALARAARIIGLLVVVWILMPTQR